MGEITQSEIMIDLDRLIIEIAACDDWETAKFFQKMIQYLDGLIDYRVAVIETTGYGVFLNDRLMKRFDTIELAHEYCVKKIASIHECDDEDVYWESYGDIGLCRGYWIGDRPFMGVQDQLANIYSVDEDDEKVHNVFNFQKAPPEAPQGLSYRNKDDAMQQLANIVNENSALRDKVHNLCYRLKEAWAAVDQAKRYYNGDEAKAKLDEWLQDNQDYLQSE